MKQLFLSLCLCLGLLPAMAQQKFMDKLVKDVAGQGTVRVVQEAAITRLVNGTMPVEAAADKAEKGKSDGSASKCMPGGIPALLDRKPSRWQQR